MELDWELAMAMGIAANSYSTSSDSAAAAPLITSATTTTTTTPAYFYGSLPPPAAVGSGGVDNLIDFSDHNLFPSTAAANTHFSYAAITTWPSSSISCSGDKFSSLQSQQSSFDLYIPQCEDAAELEWLSQFVEDSFSNVTYYESGTSNAIAPSREAQLPVEQPANQNGDPSKRSRTAAAWSSLVAPSLIPAQNSPSSPSSSSSSDLPPPKPKASGADSANKNGRGKKGGGGGGVRRCTHCESEKTPQWRTGPLGPKTLCNACGVRYKSGRLVPEYRPAASPTFVLARHSNSHRKVLELRRQKEILLRRRQENDDPSPAAASPHSPLGVHSTSKLK